MADEHAIKDTIARFLASATDPEGGSLQDQGRILSWKFACGRVQVDVLSRGLEIPQKRQIDGHLYDGLLKIDGVDGVVASAPSGVTQVVRIPSNSNAA